MKKLLFALPIYVRSEQEYLVSSNKKKLDFIEECKANYLNLIGGEITDKLKERWGNAAERYIHIIPWRYNKIIGWIEIFYDVVGTVFPYIYLADTKRFSFSTKKNITAYFDWSYRIPNKIAYIQIDTLDNNTIKEKIRNLIEELKKILPRKYFYIETESFDILSEIIDFQKLLNNKLKVTEF